MASCHTHATCCGLILPTGLLAVKKLPRISRIYTDVRLRRVSHGIHGIHRSFWRKIFSHGFHRSTQMLVPLWVHLSPLGFAACQSKKCTNRADVPSILLVQLRQLHPLGWRRGYGRMPYPPNLCASVPICGRHISARMFCVFRVFCGNTLSVCFVGAAEAAAPAW